MNIMYTAFHHFSIFFDFLINFLIDIRCPVQEKNKSEKSKSIFEKCKYQLISNLFLDYKLYAYASRCGSSQILYWFMCIN